ncbi:DUF937 domain-containing protein [Deinococcus psychrotolerans]|uniref:DUF937 domain-containing protein n=1 Tax=Deinococcus psychrotolerans TaxID=2489213 RepID=A0A3G8YC51_9DEIO|nr:DUF937 domain-containing protein [Deinococcus psychrotolerans]AZI42510.1 DUF937 domain-containing protein [Deinococcus psychrotolerans]
MDILNMLGLGQNQTAQLGQQLGVAPDQMNSALEAAVPLLISQMGHNAQDPQGAASLSQALDQHDGSAIDNLQQGNLPNLDDGQAITRHVFGGNQNSAVNAVSQRAGISPQLAIQIISMAAPLVLGYLSRNRGAGGGGMGGNLGGLGSILGSVLGGGAAGGLGSILGSVLGGGSQPQQPQYQQPQQSSGGLGDLGGMLGSIFGGGQQNSQPQSNQMGGGVGLEPVGQQSQQSGNPLEDLIGMFGGNRR